MNRNEDWKRDLKEFLGFAAGIAAAMLFGYILFAVK